MTSFPNFFKKSEIKNTPYIDKSGWKMWPLRPLRHSGLFRTKFLFSIPFVVLSGLSGLSGLFSKLFQKKRK